MNPPSRPAFFLSLKWKALLLSSIALIVVTGALVTINHIELRNQFDLRRAELQNQYAHQVQGLLDQSDKRLRKWSTTVASLLGDQPALGQKREGGMIVEFERLAAVLDLNMGVESIVLIAANGQRLAAHGLDAYSSGRIALVNATRQVVTMESPISLIDCFDTCLQFAIAPILGTGDAVVLGVSLADVVLDFQRVSGTDLGLIVEQTNTPAANGEGERWLRLWNAQVVALGNARTNLGILRAAAEGRTLADSARESIQLNVQGSEYEVRLFPLAGFEEREKAYLVTVADISEAMDKIRAGLQRNITLGTVGLVLSELLLLAILWSPLSRLWRSAVNLPWLAEGSFAKVRAAISESRLTHLFRDEVDVLNDTAIALSIQLEALNIEVANRTRDLSERMTEITRQRNFVTHVLETAQAIIMTQDRNNQILTINPYGQAITGYSLAELRGRPFVTLLAREGSVDSVRNRLADLVAGVREHVEEECEILSKDHGTLDVVWQHSRLRDQVDNALMILSVGMDITPRKKAELRLAWLADHDPLTGLFNRRRFALELKDAIAAARRYRHTGGLL
ncbi:MAG: PAS domain S-box protein, partial [Chloroflexi bacterium]|nr:PAS domain S-box protein [Chloroflexota bacterium]